MNTDQIAMTATRARERYDKDRRFRNIAQSVVADVMQRYGRVDPDHADEDAYRIATEAVTTLLEVVLTEDAELHAMRSERDAYKKFAEESVGFRPMPTMFIPAK